MHPVLRVLSAALLLSACDSSVTAPQQAVRSVGILEWRRSVGPVRVRVASSPFGPAVWAPDTVEAGVPFTVVVTTLGRSGCWWEAGAEVEQTGARAVVTPFDRTLESEATGCADVLVALPRPVRLRFTRRGEAVVQVQGRRVVGRVLNGAEPVWVERRVQVR